MNSSSFCSVCKKVTDIGEVCEIPFCSEDCRTLFHGVSIMGSLIESDGGGDPLHPIVLKVDNKILTLTPKDGNIETEKTFTNIYTDEHMEFAIETVPVADKIKKEIHPTQTQFIRIEEGAARIDIFYLNDNETLYRTFKLKEGSCLIIHSSTYHEVTNIGDTVLKFSTVYSPRVH